MFLEVFNQHTSRGNACICARVRNVKCSKSIKIRLGTVDQMRYYCQKVLNGEELDFASFDGTIINGMYFRCDKASIGMTPNRDEENSINPELQNIINNQKTIEYVKDDTETISQIKSVPNKSFDVMLD